MQPSVTIMWIMETIMCGTFDISKLGTCILLNII